MLWTGVALCGAVQFRHQGCACHHQPITSGCGHDAGYHDRRGVAHAWPVGQSSREAGTTVFKAVTKLTLYYMMCVRGMCVRMRVYILEYVHEGECMCVRERMCVRLCEGARICE